MDGGALHDRKIGLVKAAITSYGEQIFEGDTTTNKLLLSNYSENSYTKRRELHLAKRDTDQFSENRKLAESVTAEAESKLYAAKKTVKNITLKIEESKAQTQKLEKLKMAKRREDEWNSEDQEFSQVLRELESIKLDLSKLKLDMASILEEKRKADKETEFSCSNTESSSSLILSLTKKVEEVNEEHVLVELARIEATKEFNEIEARKREEASKHLATMEETEWKKQSMIQEIEEAKELERKLAIKISDINMLEGELKQIKEINLNFNNKDTSNSSSLLETVKRELEDTKKEFKSVKDESFQFLTSMDVVTNEHRHVVEETARLRRKEEKVEMVVQNLSTKLLRAKAKLAATSAAEDKAKLIASNLSVTLEQFKSEVETAKTERSLNNEETAMIKAEIQKTDTEINLAEERLQDAVQDLKAVKSSEAKALENLKEIIENTIRNRASASQHSSTITVSKFEYEYLKGHAAEAKEIADKKVAAARAWANALKASEKEILIKTEQLRRESREFKVGEDQEVHKAEPSAKEVANEFESWRKMQPESAFPSKATNRSVKITPARRLKSRKSATPIIRVTSRGTPGTIKRREKVISNLSQIFSGKDKN